MRYTNNSYVCMYVCVCITFDTVRVLMVDSSELMFLATFC